MRFKALVCGIAAAVLCTVAALAVSCTPDPSDKGYLDVTVVSTDLGYKASKQFVGITSNVSWNIQVTEDWVSFDKTSGSGNASVIMSWEENSSSEERSCTITFSGTGVESQQVRLVQAASPNGPVTSLKSDYVRAWLELPAIPEGEADRYFITHPMKIAAKNYDSRNYSFYYDANALISLWVAYPLNDDLVGNGSRTDEWGLDPKVPDDCQPVLYKGFRGGYERGHQLPSADRLRYSENVTTFYSTNMTPQRGELNQNAWAELEGMVRSWSKSFDTLYVVTGADITGSNTYAWDNEGKSVLVPSGYFKALLGYKSRGSAGISAQTGGYTGIAFYFEHKAYSNVMSQAMTIDELERKLGYDFFVNLPALIGAEKADKVESTRDSWWK